MDTNILKRALKSRNLQNRDAAIFQLSFLKHDYRDLLLAIFYCEAGNTQKAISLLERYATATSKYYEGMCYYKEEKYEKAISALSEIIEKEVLFDDILGDAIDDFLIGESEIFYVYELLGECYTKNYERAKALVYYKLSLDIYPLIKSFNNLLLENKKFDIKNKEILEYDYFKDRMTFYYLIRKNPEDKQILVFLKKYKKKYNNLSSFFISEAAKDFYEINMNEDSISLFEYLRRKDQNFLNNLDFYSTALWHSKNSQKLILLSKFLTTNHPESYISWTVLGNYFSLKSDINRAILSFKRSTRINAHWYAFSLLGHEHVAQQDFNVAKSYFTMSFKLFTNNYNAIFGIGSVYMHLQKYPNCTFYLLKALKLNENNLFLKILSVRYLIRIEEISHAYEIICKGLNITSSSYEKTVEDLMKIQMKKDEETLCVELVDIFLSCNMMKEAQIVLDICKYKDDAYNCKNKNLEIFKARNYKKVENRIICD